MECGLKACVLAYVERTGKIFRDKEFSKKCFTHKLIEIIGVAGLIDLHNDRLKTSPALAASWTIAKDWTEASRYRQLVETDARELYEAVTRDPDGVLPWIRMYW